MVSLLHVSLIGFLLLAVVIVQAKPLVETSNNTDENKSPMGNQQLYELYKVMRTDPRLATVSNNDIVLYIYRNFILGNGDVTDFGKQNYRKLRRNRHRQTIQAE